MSAGGSLLAVALGGAIGAVLRWLATVATVRLLGGGAPLGTMIVNVVGCFLLAWLVASADRWGLGPGARLFLGTGVLGALTTFSTFGLDAHGLLLAGRGGAAAAYLVGTLLASAVAVAAGWSVGRAG